MRNLYLIIFITLILQQSCSKKNESTIDTTPLKYKPLKLKRIYTLGQGHEIHGFNHFVTVENYNEEGDNFLVSYADKYRDSCKTKLPIWTITFCKPFDFISNYDSEDDEPLRKHSLVSISYSKETLHKTFPDIESVTFWNDGKPTYIQILTLERQKEKGYYDSSGKYDRGWIEDFNKKFKKEK